MVGRLKPGVTLEQAREDANRVAQETMRNYPAFMASLQHQPRSSTGCTRTPSRRPVR